MRTLVREGFDSSALRQYGSVVQLAERMAVNHEVLGSSPSRTATGSHGLGRVGSTPAGGHDLAQTNRQFFVKFKPYAGRDSRLYAVSVLILFERFDSAPR